MFRVVSSSRVASNGSEVLLVEDNWNDWFKWYTQFYAIVVAPDGTRTEIGHVKIAREGMSEENGKTLLPPSFPALGEGWFSMGQSENYYDTLNSLGDEYRAWFLSALKDCAKDLSLLERYAGEMALRVSVLRDIDSNRVQNRLHRLATGNTALTDFAFSFELPRDPRAVDDPPELQFRVKPGSHPPSNIHVIIGRNGVGKSRCFDYLGRAVLGLNTAKGQSPGTLTPLETASSISATGHGFAGLVTVSFSPFDKYGPLVSNSGALEVRYAYVGLIRESAQSRESGGRADGDIAPLTIKSQPDLFEDFREGIRACRVGARRNRWAKALECLQADPLFEEAEVSAIVDDDQDGWEDRAWTLFKKLSSGHSIVLLIITKLVELVEEKSLVLIDEPEGHLHPPLLSAFIRALSDLLTDRNGVAIIATHSPVVLQEVPRTCAWMLSRSGLSSRADRPQLETFGENVGTLTHEVFGLEVMQTGFYRRINEAVEGRSYDEVLAHFQDRLGGEGRALARTLTLLAGEGDSDETLDD